MTKQENTVAELRQGRCQCGYIFYQVPSNPLTFYACHCTQCRAQSASAFGLSYLIRPGDFLLVSGQLTTQSTVVADGLQKIAAFCGKCGTRVYHASSDSTQPLSIKAGTLASIADLRPVAHIWTDSALPWVLASVSQTRCFSAQPQESCLIRLWGEQT